MYICRLMVLLGFCPLVLASSTLNGAHYSFRIGRIKATVVSDGVGVMNASVVAPSVHPDAIENVLSMNYMSNGALTTFYNPLHLDMGGDRRVMIDVGSGSGLDPGLGKLLENMAQAGLDPNAVTDIMISHVHPDHIGGVLKPDGSLAFPNATVHVSRIDYGYWTTVRPEEMQPQLPMERREVFVKVAVDALNAVADKLRFFELGAEVIPGITSRDVRGHTPGASAFIIRDGNDSLMNIGDILLWDVFSIRHPEWPISLDTDSEAGIATRFSVLNELADSKMMFLSYHNNFPGLGYIYRQGEGYGHLPIRYEF